jgi:NADH:ubiquinone oxidoreductase subunit 3 (subunit A)
MGEIMSGLESVPSAYLSIGFLTILGIIMPLTNFAITWVVRPRVDPARPHITRSYLLEGYERDHSLYPRRLTTFECGSEPVGDAMIQFHFQYYWYAIIFLVFDVAFMFLVLGGMVASDATSVGAADGAVEEAKSALLLLGLFFTIMSLGVWYVFRKRGRIYILWQKEIISQRSTVALW